MPLLFPFFISLTVGDFLSKHIFNKTLSYAMNNTSAFVEKDGSTVYSTERVIISVFRESVRRDHSGIKEKMTLDKYKLFGIVSDLHC